MASSPLAKLLGPRGELLPVLRGLLAGLTGPICVLDQDGQVLAGALDGPAEMRVPVLCDGESAGWVTGGADAANIAALLTYLLAQAAEKKSLAGELLERYRELNLLYHLSERMAAFTLPDAVAGAALDEAVRLIPADAGMIIMAREIKSDGPVWPGAPVETEYQTSVSAGCPFHLRAISGLVERVLTLGKAEVANGLAGGDYFAEAEGKCIDLLCAPLKTEKRVLGAILLIGGPDRTFNAGELKLLNTIAMQVAPVIEISRLYQVAVENARIEQELNMARQVQNSLLPDALPQFAGWSFSKRWRPARQVAGDFYDMIDEDPHQLGLVIADVTDKGLPAALFMVFARSALRASIGQGGPPDSVVTHANRLICQDSHGGLFASLVYARLQVQTGELCYVNAGHNPPIFYRAETDDLQLLTRTGLPLGVEEDVGYTACSVQMRPGDFILFYTDGLTEAVNTHEKEFGMERVKQVVFDHRQASAESLLAALEGALDDYVMPLALHDDVTLMVVRRD